MSSTPKGPRPTPVETLHLVVALSAAALGLVLGLAARKAAWVEMGVSLILLLPPQETRHQHLPERPTRVGTAWP